MPSEQDLRRAFRLAARAIHPDGGGPSGDVAALRAARDLLLQAPHGDDHPGGRERVFVRRRRRLTRAADRLLQRRRHAGRDANRKVRVITMRTPHVGLFLGAILGFALIVEGFGEMLIVALFAALGWLVASVIAGTIDVGEVLSSQRDRSAGRR